MESNNKQDITEASLLNLVMKDSQFIELAEALPGFSPFEVLRLKDYEIRHSNMLAWLFDPNASHSFGESVATRFIFDVYSRNKDIFSHIDIASIYRNGIADLEVYRELGKIDILLVSDLNRLVVIVENKWHAGEEDTQLNRYFEYVKEKYADYQILAVFLTLDGKPPASEENKQKYGVTSYSDIIALLDSVLRSKEASISNEIREFITHYVNLLKEKLGMDEKNKNLQKLCREIYSKHRDVIDKIYEVGNDQSIALGDAIERFSQNCKLSPECCIRQGRRFVFVPPRMALDSAKITDQDPTPYAIFCWFEFKYNENKDEHKIVLIAEAGAFNSQEKRIELLTALEGSGISAGSKAAKNKNGGRYSRIGTAASSTKIGSYFDTDKVVEIMDNLYAKRAGDLDVVEAVMKDFDWNDA